MSSGQMISRAIGRCRWRQASLQPHELVTSTDKPILKTGRVQSSLLQWRRHSNCLVAGTIVSNKSTTRDNRNLRLWKSTWHMSRVQQTPRPLRHARDASRVLWWEVVGPVHVSLAVGGADEDECYLVFMFMVLVMILVQVWCLGAVRQQAITCWRHQDITWTSVDQYGVTHWANMRWQKIYTIKIIYDHTGRDIARNMFKFS